jgi:hypothetical protein
LLIGDRKINTSNNSDDDENSSNSSSNQLQKSNSKFSIKNLIGRSKSEKKNDSLSEKKLDDGNKEDGKKDDGKKRKSFKLF